jgi:hypothetical protein
LKKTQLLPVPVVPAEPTVAASRDSKPAEPSPVVDGWLKKINPMVWFGSHKPAGPKPALPCSDKLAGPVQGELSLDNIKVMRNDLSETDVEIVPAKSHPAKVAAPAQASVAAMAIPELPPATNAWEYLGERMLGRD